jgi:hypothetical protein
MPAIQQALVRRPQGGRSANGLAMLDSRKPHLLRQDNGNGDSLKLQVWERTRSWRPRPVDRQRGGINGGKHSGVNGKQPEGGGPQHQRNTATTRNTRYRKQPGPMNVASGGQQGPSKPTTKNNAGLCRQPVILFINPRFREQLLESYTTHQAIKQAIAKIMASNQYIYM